MVLVEGTGEDYVRGGMRTFEVEEIGNTHSSRRAGEREFFESWMEV